MQVQQKPVSCNMYSGLPVDWNILRSLKLHYGKRNFKTTAMAHASFTTRLTVCSQSLEIQNTMAWRP